MSVLDDFLFPVRNNNCTLFDWNDEELMEEDLKNDIGSGNRK